MGLETCVGCRWNEYCSASPTYEGKVDFKMPSTILPSNDSNIKNITVHADGSIISFLFETNYENEADALYATNKELIKIEKMIFFTFEEKICDLDWKSQVKTNDAGEKVLMIKDKIDLDLTLTVRRNYNSEDTKKLKLNLEAYRTESDIYNVLIDILKMKDKVGSFVMLYSLLNIYVGPTQMEIDRYIKGKKPEIEMRPTTKEGKNYEETIYTSLRNQLAHLSVSSNTETNQIMEEINRHFKDFSDLVKQMLVEKKLI
ncbi:hypothetical protein [Paenibacillus timonensis]|uniref:hypothetical protein n=1 Tax=Paenibacillus timonensis TaxID=225915 RepID=UPI0022E2C7E1|nr:hypothetical protein [Paenibacillus timonensis]